MPAKSEVRVNLKGLDDFKKAFAGSYKARVGILGQNVARTDEKTGMTNAEIGAIQMFGSLTRNIPPRDFLMMPIQSHEKEIVAGMNKASVKAAFDRGDYKKVLQMLGLIAEGFVQQAFESAGFGQWEPNKPSTIARKGSSRPLIDTGQLRRAISSDVVKKGST